MGLRTDDSLIHFLGVVETREHHDIFRYTRVKVGLGLSRAHLGPINPLILHFRLRVERPFVQGS